MPFLLPNQQCQNTERNATTFYMWRLSLHVPSDFFQQYSICLRTQLPPAVINLTTYEQLNTHNNKTCSAVANIPHDASYQFFPRAMYHAPFQLEHQWCNFPVSFPLKFQLNSLLYNLTIYHFGRLTHRHVSSITLNSKHKTKNEKLRSH